MHKVANIDNTLKHTHIKVSYCVYVPETATTRPKAIIINQSEVLHPSYKLSTYTSFEVELLSFLDLI